MPDIHFGARKQNANVSISIPTEYLQLIDKLVQKVGCTRSRAAAALMEPGVQLMRAGKKLPAEGA